MAQTTGAMSIWVSGHNKHRANMQANAKFRGFMLRATLAIGPFLLFFVYKFNSTIAYIRDAITNDKWKDGFTALERAIYYSPFSQIGWQSWGKLHVFFLIFSLSAVVAAIRLRRLSYLVSLFILLAISAAFFAPLILPHTSFISFAATFLGVIMATTIVSMDFICRSFPRSGGWVVLAVTALIASSTTLPFSNSAYFDPAVISNTAPARASIVIGEDELHQIANTYENVVQDIYDHRRPNAPNIIVFFDYMFAPHPNIAIKYFQKTGHLPKVDRVDDLADPNVQCLLSSADFVLTMAPNSKATAQPIPYLYPVYPISHDPGRADDVVRALGKFSSIGIFGVRGGEIHLYRAANAPSESN
jgi:hypothetical protein